MDSKNHILIAEDDAVLLELVQSLLEPHFHISCAKSGTEALERINETAFLFVILDIHLPGMSGLEVCESLQQKPASQRPHVVILSGDAEPDKIRQAYRLNVDDYILKPVNGLGFVQRMCRLERDLVYLHNLQSQEGQAKDMAHTAMTQAAGYGGAFDLVSKLNSCASAEEVARCVAKDMQANGYFVAVEIRGFDRTIHHDVDTEACSEVELKIFELLHSQGRIYAFGKRCIFNDTMISILVKNMPEQGSRESDLLLDVAAKLMPAIDLRLQALRNELALKDTTVSLKDALSLFSTGVSEMETRKQRLLHEMESKISEGFHQLGLSEEQERYFIVLVEEIMDKNAEDGNFGKLNDLLVGCHQNIQRCLQENNNSAKAQEPDQDVELF